MKQLTTKRLVLRPMTDEALAAAIAAETDPHMQKALSEMLAGCRAHPEARLFSTNWEILEKNGGPVGSLGFHGPAVNGAVEIGYGVDAAYEGKGYATEAATALMAWAYAQKDVYWIQAEAEPNNAASQRVLEKLGFQPTGEIGEEGPRYEKEKPPSAWCTTGMMLGMSIGIAYGTSRDELATWMSIGMGLGLAVGTAADSADAKKRATLRRARENGEKRD